MNLSNEVDQLFKALAVFQGELDNASKDTQGHGYKYADLAACINTAKPVLAKNGLSVSQMLGMSDSGAQTLITILAHSSGQWMSSEFVMSTAVLSGGSGKNPVQVLGSAITYQRRYSYAAIIGMAQEDDDGASNQKKSQPAVKMANQNEQANIQAHAESLGYTAQDVCQQFNIQRLSEVPADQVTNTINAITQWGNKK